MKYFDNASTTKISKHALDTYINASEMFFNPSSLYKQASEVKQKLEDVRSFFIKKLKGKQNSTFIFTGCATESNNAVLNSTITRKDRKYIFSAGEHSSIYETAKKYKEEGYNIVFIPLNNNGSINTQLLLDEIDDKTALVSIIHVSNETGAINDIATISKQIRKVNPNIVIHSDGVQAVGKVDINLKDMDVDYYTLSAHKINGPKGVGGLYIAKPNKFKQFIFGGGQEFGLRAGTENIAGILSFRTAFENVAIHSYNIHKQVLINNLEGDYLIVSDNECVDNIISICFKGVRGETIEHMLEQKDILIGTGSACNSKAKVNRVLSGIVPKEYLDGAIRISFGEEITIEDCKELAVELSKAVKIYRERINK